MIDLQKTLYQIFKESVFNINTDNIYFEYSENIKNQLSDLSIVFENIRNKKIIIEKENIPLSIYLYFSDYLKINEVVKQKPILILNLDGQAYSYIDKKTFINFEEVNDNFFFKNSICYTNFIKFIKSQDIDSEDSFHFVDYVNSDNRKIVFTSLSEKGRIILKYYIEIKHFNDEVI